MSELAAHRVADVLGSALGAEVTVGELAPVTAGARRINVLFDAMIDGEPHGFCLTQQPNQSEAFERSMLDEAHWLRNATAAGMRVAEVITASEDLSLLGGPLFISRRIEGVTIPKQVIGLCERHDGLGARVAHELGESLARLHASPLNDVPATVEHPAGSAADAALAWADEQMALMLQRSPALELVLRWLAANQPPAVPLCPVHGDVRNGNIIVNEQGLGAILDWETAHIGEPFEDLAWLAQRMWRARNDQFEIGGFAHRSDLRTGYVAAGGAWDDDRFHWWKVFRTLWWGVGLANQARQHLDGSYRSIVMAASGRRVAELEWDALCLIEGR